MFGSGLADPYKYRECDTNGILWMSCENRISRGGFSGKIMGSIRYMIILS